MKLHPMTLNALHEAVVRKHCKEHNTTVEAWRAWRTKWMRIDLTSKADERLTMRLDNRFSA